MHGATKTVKILQVARATLFVGMMLWCWLSTHAQQGRPLPVGVSFQFTEPKIVSSFDSEDNRPGVEAKVTAQFIASLQARFNYWTFVSPTPDTSVILKLWLEEEKKSGAIKLWLQILRGGQILPQQWEAPAMLPGEKMTTGFPKGAKWIDKLQPVFDGELLQQNNQEILDALKSKAPVGKETIFMPLSTNPEILPRAILALDSAQYDALGQCGFKINYNWTQGGIATIHSSGIGMHAPYPPASPPYDGIVVQLEDFSQGNNKMTREQLLQNLPNLSPVEFYLETIKGPGSE
jgi:hypothetical protein